MRHVCSIAACTLAGMLCSSAALAQGRAPSSPWSRLFPLPTDRIEGGRTTPSLNLLAQSPTIVRERTLPCSRFASTPVDPAFDAEMRQAAPSRPAPASRSLQPRACQPSK